MISSRHSARGFNFCVYLLRFAEGQACAAKHRCKFIEVSTVLNYKLDELLVGIVTQVRLKRQATSTMSVVMTEATGCYDQALTIVDRLFGKRHPRRHRSCDNLLSL